MLTLAEFALLARQSFGLWRRFLPVLLGWAALAFTCTLLGQHLSTLIAVAFDAATQGAATGLEDVAVPAWQSTTARVVETLVFVLGIIGSVICTVLMIASVQRGLAATTRPEVRAAVPGVLDPGRSRREILLHTVAPFLAVYALLGFADEQITALFHANLSMTGGTRFQAFSISWGDWPIYLGLAAAAWVVLAATQALQRARPALGLTLIGLLAKGLVVLAGFMGLGGLAAQARVWFTGRAVWMWVQTGWVNLTNALPDIRLWFELTLPEALRAAAAGFWQLVVPGFLDAVIVPLLWLALTAAVYGWHDFRAGVRLDDTEAAVAERLRAAGSTRVGRRAVDAVGSGPLRVAWGWLAGKTEDYLPVFQALRLLGRAGPRFVGAYLVLANLVNAVGALWWRGAMAAIGPQNPATTFLYQPLVGLAEQLLVLPLAVALYATAFDRALFAAARGVGHAAAPEASPAVTAGTAPSLGDAPSPA